MASGIKFIPTEEMIEWMRKNNGPITNIEMKTLFEKQFEITISRSLFQRFRRELGLKSGLTGRFEKGNISWNKGKRMEVKGRMAETQFKKGMTPKNKRQVGEERVDIYGYTEIKVADPDVWDRKHNVIWESINGKRPKGHVVIFLDGNKQNFDIDNLKLVSRSELVRLNQQKMITNDTELTRTNLNIVKLNNILFERMNKK